MTLHLQYCLTLNVFLSIETKVVKVKLIISKDKYIICHLRQFPNNPRWFVH